MAAKRNFKKEAQCDGKVRHESREKAMITIKKMNNDKLHAYHCVFCGFWHAGHKWAE